ncbi:hypothetical protein KRR26_34970 [Corallococcus sp. M34]|uniref:S-4TM family putative pore-forming effector n=1 Tax=Citreicoccus inhibens TaxID=2849499 RepID=UPI001C24DC0E|nr:S-4TM family putative pore-forming effector [Citreicoccus inhibens]MBU8900820.1 hypothetical protein [Citreicoccus inhibens]
MSASSDIAIRQNFAENLERLAAQRVLYSRGKLARGASAFMGTLLAIASIPTALFCPTLSAGLSLAALLWTFVELILVDGVEDKNRQMAALIQEDFDTQVFGLAWNPALGARPIPETIVDAGRSGKGDERLKGWYPDLSMLPRPLEILACQRTCVVWDHRARGEYQLLLTITALALVVAAITAGVATGQSLSNFLVGFAVPIVPALQHCIKTIKAHRRAHAAQDLLSGDIDMLWTEGVKSKGRLSDLKLRQVQDRLLLYRREQPAVPDYLYWRQRSRYEVAMRETAQRLIKEALDKLSR